MTKEQAEIERLRPLLRRLSWETKTYKKNFIPIHKQRVKPLEGWRI